MAKEKHTKVEITQTKSTISQTLRQKRTISALGLGKINKTAMKTLTTHIKAGKSEANELLEMLKTVDNSTVPDSKGRKTRSTARRRQ